MWKLAIMFIILFGFNSSFLSDIKLERNKLKIPTLAIRNRVLVFALYQKEAARLEGMLKTR